MPALFSLLFSKAGLVGMVVLGLVALFGVMEVRVKLAQHGEQSARADAQAAQDGWKTCRGTLAAQNASLAAQAARSAAALATSGKQVAAVAPRSAHIAAQAAALNAHAITGADRCSRWEDAETAVRESLK